MRTIMAAAIAALLFFLLSPGLLAQSDNIPDDFNDEGTPPITGSIGLGVGYAPKYIGAREYRPMALPIVFLNYGPVFLSSEKGLGVRFDLFEGSLEISPAVNYRFPRKESVSPMLAGLGDVNGVLTLGGTIAYKFDDFVLSMRTFQGVNEYKGLTMDIKAAYLNRSHERFNYGLSVSTSIADKSYNQANFGVTPLQSARSGYRSFDASAGFNDIGLKGTFDFFLTPSFSVDVFAGYNHLMGDAAASPIVERGSEDQFSTGLAFMYHFGR
ncbi:MAG: MipA/OmpV family protein [Deltaproteobacteria bacterium]|jgi:outer membrane protein|nr:MipA/OmpV family protein [Deltaproteobacteria bacterium]